MTTRPQIPLPLTSYLLHLPLPKHWQTKDWENSFQESFSDSYLDRISLTILSKKHTQKEPISNHSSCEIHSS